MSATVTPIRVCRTRTSEGTASAQLILRSVPLQQAAIHTTALHRVDSHALADAPVRLVAGPLEQRPTLRAVGGTLRPPLRTPQCGESGMCLAQPDCPRLHCEGHPQNQPTAAERSPAARARFWRPYLALQTAVGLLALGGLFLAR